MTGSQRFAALMQGQVPDRVPIVCNMFEQGAQELGVSIKEYYARGELVAEGQLRLQEKYGYDNLWAYFYGALEAEVLGCRQIIYVSDGPPNVGQMILSKPEDLLNFDLPADLSSHPRYAELLACLSILKEKSQGRWPVFAAVTASFTLPAILMGIGPWLELMLNGDPILREHLLELCSRFCSQQISLLREAGADLIIYNNPVASATFITPKKFRELALPWVKRDLELSGPDGIVFFNGGGKINPILDDLFKGTGIGAYYLNPFDDVMEARNILGPKALIAGPINDIRMLDWSPQDVEQDVQRIMQSGKKAGGFIFGTMVMPFGIPDKNIRAMMDAAERYGTYTNLK